MRSAAAICANEAFVEEYKSALKGNKGAAEVYFEMLSDRTGREYSSNDILGIEYIKAAKRNNINISFFTVKREGNAYLDDVLRQNEFPSASALRKAWKNQEMVFEGYIPKEAETVFKRAIEDGGLIDNEALGRAYMMFFRLCDSEEISRYAECEGGIANRIVATAKESASYAEFFEKLKTKRYTDAKLRRALLFALCRVESDLLSKSPEYTYLLGANDKGRELLSRVKKSGVEQSIKTITKPADAPKNTKQYDAEDRLNSIFTIFKASSESQSDEYRKNAYIK